MLIEILSAEPPTVALLQADDFNALSVRLSPEIPGSTTDLGSWGVLKDGVAWLDVNVLREAVMAAPEARVDGKDRFDAMISYANRAGWFDEAANRVRAHIESGR